MKWTTTAGPIQTKKVSEALREISWEGNCKTELWGTKGVDERSSTVTEVFGTPRPESAAALAAIFGKYQGQITRENYAKIVADCVEAVAELKKTRPVVDKRTTPEENVKRKTEYEILEAERAVEKTKRDQAIAARVAELKVLYPWAKQDGSGHARAAANIKKELGMTFPGVAFSVKSDSFSMGNSVHVCWSLGPTEDEVRKITGKYEAGSFDGMTDCYNYDDSVEAAAVKIHLGQSKYVMENRRIPQETLEQLSKDLCVMQGVAYVGHYTKNLLGENDNQDVSRHAYQILAKTSFPGSKSYKGVRYASPDERNGQTWAVAEFA